MNTSQGHQIYRKYKSGAQKKKKDERERNRKSSKEVLSLHF